MLYFICLITHKLKCLALPVDLKNNQIKKNVEKKKLKFVKPMLPAGYPRVPSNNISQFGPPVWAAMDN